jgi:hypothetical protein
MVAHGGGGDANDGTGVEDNVGRGVEDNVGRGVEVGGRPGGAEYSAGQVWLKQIRIY